MTRKDIVHEIANSYADGVAMAMRGTFIDSDVLSGLIAQTYMEAFENGISYHMWDKFPSEMFNLETDADYYNTYAKEELK